MIPPVSVETWKALVAAAHAFNSLAPWDWMHDSAIIGLRHPVSKEVLLGSILGRLRTVFALLVYRGVSGHRWLLNTVLNDGDSGGFEREDTAFEQDCVKAEFVQKRELTKEDHALLTGVSYAPQQKRGPVWPQFRSIVPGGYPWHVTQAEAETLLFALPRVAAVARLLRESPTVLDGHLDGDIAFVPDQFDPAVSTLRAEDLDWEPMIPPPEPMVEPVSLDASTMAKWLKLTQPPGFHLELDVTYSNFPILSDGRPRFPKLAMAVDHVSGFVGGFRLADFKDRDGASALGVVLRDTLTQLGYRPEVFLVQRPRVAAMLTKVAGELGIPAILEIELPALNAAREGMEQHFQR